MTATSHPLTIATICARGGSKGLPNKNVRDFWGQPLVARTIAQARICAFIDAVYVSTDDAEIAKVARQAGALVPLMRPAALATDDAAKLPVIEHLVAHVESHLLAQGQRIHRIVDLQPTSPLRTVHDITSAIELANASSQAELVVSVREAADNPYFNLVEADAAGWLHLSKGMGETRRQSAPPVYALNGAIYVWQRAALAHAAVHGLWSVQMSPYVMPASRSMDIDTLEDFEYALWLHARQNSTPQPTKATT